MSKVKIDIYSGEAYDATRHHVCSCYWSDGRLCYWGWIMNRVGKIIGDFTAPTMQDAEKALCVKFEEA